MIVQLTAEAAAAYEDAARIIDRHNVGLHGSNMLTMLAHEMRGRIDGKYPDIGSYIPPSEVLAVIRARRLRNGYFPPAIFADPAWDILLDLYAHALREQRVSVSSLCIAAAVPSTTGLRWIGQMEAAGVLYREECRTDRRRVFMHLTTAAHDGMRDYLLAISRNRLSLARGI